MFSAAAAAFRRSRSKSTMQISGVGVPIQSIPGSLSWVRYSAKFDRRRIRGADSAKDLSAEEVSSSRQTPTTDSGSEFEKLSRGALLSASLIESGFIWGSMVADFVSYLY